MVILTTCYHRESDVDSTRETFRESQVTHICVEKLGHHWFKLRVVTCSASIHHLNQWWVVVKWTFWDKFEWHMSYINIWYIHIYTPIFWKRKIYFIILPIKRQPFRLRPNALITRINYLLNLTDCTVIGGFLYLMVRINDDSSIIRPFLGYKRHCHLALEPLLWNSGRS